MSRGDKRERDRAKNQAKLQAKTASKSKSGNIVDRNASDKSALEAKIARKAKQKQEEEAAAASAVTKVVRKKGAGVKKVDEGLDDLLSAGLNKSKKKK